MNIDEKSLTGDGFSVPLSDMIEVLNSYVISNSLLMSEILRKLAFIEMQLSNEPDDPDKINEYLKIVSEEAAKEAYEKKTELYIRLLQKLD